jgi:ankyrin repeat protein
LNNTFDLLDELHANNQLWSALKRMDVAMVRKTVDWSNINELDHDGRTPLEYTITIGSQVVLGPRLVDQYEIVRILLERGADPYRPSRHGPSPYAMARDQRMKRFIERWRM